MISVGAAEAGSMKTNDMVRNMRTGEAFLVAGGRRVTGDLTSSPSLGDVASAAGGRVGDKLLFIGSAFPQGSTLPDDEVAASARWASTSPRSSAPSGTSP